MPTSAINMKMIKNLLLVIFAAFITPAFAQTSEDTASATALIRLEKIRADIISDKIDFATAAKQYSQDPGSASNGGLYANIPRGTFVPEFEAAAFSIETNKVSEVFKTQFGYHILRVDSRRGDVIDVRHILIAPK